MSYKIDLEIIFRTKLKEIKDEAKYSNCNNNDNGVYKIYSILDKTDEFENII